MKHSIYRHRSFGCQVLHCAINDAGSCRGRLCPSQSWDRYRTLSHDPVLSKDGHASQNWKSRMKSRSRAHSIATDQLSPSMAGPILYSSRCRVLAFLPFCSAYLFARNCPVRADEPDLPLLVHSMMTSPQGWVCGAFIIHFDRTCTRDRTASSTGCCLDQRSTFNVSSDAPFHSSAKAYSQLTCSFLPPAFAKRGPTPS
jgi:hypothetical protein